MDDDRSWLKNPIIPPPPGVPRFSSAELKLVNDERPPSTRALPRQDRLRRVERRAPLRVSGTTTAADSSVKESELPESRRSA